MGKSDLKNSAAVAINQQKSDLPDKLAQPARRALTAAGIQRLEQLTKLSEAEVKQLHGIGPNALKQLRQALAAQFATDAAVLHAAERRLRHTERLVVDPDDP